MVTRTASISVTVVTNADLRRGARSPSPSVVRLAGHIGLHGQRRRALQSIRPDGATLKGTAPCDHPGRTAVSMDR
jgi:hypothetical protein